MAKKRKPIHRQKGHYQRRFDETDCAWLAEQFQKQSAQNPDLTLEAFAFRYGVQPKLIKRFIPQGTTAEMGPLQRSINLWHGTTKDRASAIIEQGFRTLTGTSKKIWFTRKPREAHSIAKHRSQQRGGTPVVFHCNLNLTKYSEFDNPKPDHYAFSYSYISKDVIRQVVGIVREKTKRKKVEKPLKEKASRGGSIDVIVTKTSGKLGVLCWINAYLEIKGVELLNESDPAVDKISQWVEAQYAEGREEPISDEEMLIQTMMYVKSEAEIGEKA